MLSEKLQQVTAELAPHFKPAFLQRQHTLFQFCFEEDDPFHLLVNGSDFRFLEGETPSPTLTLYLDSHETCWGLLTGAIDGMEAFMTGRYRADGNIVLSQLLLHVFKSEDPRVPYLVKD